MFDDVVVRFLFFSFLLAYSLFKLPGQIPQCMATKRWSEINKITTQTTSKSIIISSFPLFYNFTGEVSRLSAAN